MDPDRTSVFYGVKKHLRKKHSEDLVTQFFRIGGYSGLAAAIMFVLHVVMARLLGPARYSEYGVYVAILFTFFIAATSVQLVITRFVSYHRTRFQNEQINYLVTKSLKWMFIVGAGLFAVTVVFADPISTFFGVEEVLATALLGFVLWFVIMQPVFEGAFRGVDDMQSLGRMRLVEAVVRFVLVVSAVLAGFSVAGAVFGLGAGTFVALAFSYKHIYRIQRLKAVAPNLRSVRRYAVPVVLTMSSFALLLNLDIILVKYYFPPAEAGVFVAASFLAKIPVFVSIVFAGVLFPRVTRLFVNGKPSGSLLKHALVVITFLMTVFTFASFFFAQPLLALIFGSEYVLGPVVGFYVFGMSALAISIVLIVYLLAINKDRCAFALPLFVLGFILLLVLFNSSTTQVILSVMLLMTSLAAYAVYSAREVLEFDYFL